MYVVSGHLVEFTDGGKIYRGESGLTGVFTCIRLCFDMRCSGNDENEQERKAPG